MSQEVYKLIDAGFGYRIKNGDIYFDVSKFSRYGEKTTLSPELQLKLAADRGGDPHNTDKRNPLDFLLWKMIDKSEYPGWDTALGYGRPGWHIECSVMSQANLDMPITIHGGGLDLLFPHHASEMAQSEALGVDFVANWMYVAPLLYKGEKMSKSLGNLVFAKDILEDYEPQVLRLALMHYYYRTGGEWCEGLLDEMNQSWKLVKNALKTNSDFDSSEHMKKFLAYADNDLSLPRMCEVLLSLSADIVNHPAEGAGKNNDLKTMLNICGLEY
jgi:cysteinyl-tRNA synthetase